MCAQAVQQLGGKARRRTSWCRRCLGMLALAVFLAITCSGPLPPAWALPAAGTLREHKPTGRFSADPLAAGSNKFLPSVAPAVRQMHFEQISVEQGLSQSTVNCILQDRFGFLWIGTQDGLNKYNGYHFEVYRSVAGVNSLIHNSIWAIQEDPSGALWIGTSGGLDHYDRETGRFTHYQNVPDDPASLSSNLVTALYLDRAGTLWIGTRGGGLNALVPRSGGETTEPNKTSPAGTAEFIRYQHHPQDPHSLSDNNVWSIYEDREGVLWIGTEKGLNRFDRQSEVFTPYYHDPREPHSLSSNTIWSILEDDQGTFWVGTSEGLNRFDRQTGDVSRYRSVSYDPATLSSNATRTLHQDREGQLWIGTDGGLHLFDRQTGQFIRFQHNPNNPYSLSNDAVRAIYQDREGLLWIGTYGGGLNRAGPAVERFVHYWAVPGDPSSLSDKLVWAAFQDREGMLWVGTSSGLNVLDRDSGLNLVFQNSPGDFLSLNNNVVRAILQDRQGDLWIGTDGGGLDRLVKGKDGNLKTARFQHYPHNPFLDDTLSSSAVRTIYEDREGNLWVGTLDGGLNRFDRASEKFVRYQHIDKNPYSLSHDTVWAIYEDRQGALWIGTEMGLNRYDRETDRFARYEYRPDDPRSLSHSTVMSILQDHEGVLWVGTAGGGLNRFDQEKETFTAYREENGLPNNVVYGILEDGQGFLWLSTNKGLSRFDPRTETFTNYDASDGLQSNEFNAGAYHKGRNGEMFFGGINGLTVFYPKNITANPYAPPIVLTALTQGGEAFDTAVALEMVQEVTLRWPNSFFEFEFAALSYSQPEKNQYAYILEGLEREWNYIGTKRFGRYTSLPGGTYTLRIKGSNQDGTWNEQGIAISVIVVPPFWQTWWFIAIAVVLLVGGVAGGYWWRVRSVEASRRELASLVDERTQTLAQRTREIERSSQEIEALYQADERLYRHLHLDQLLQALVDTAVEILHADKGTLMVWDSRRERLIVRAARGFNPETIARMSFAPGEGVAGHVAVTGEPLIVEDIDAERRATRTIVEAEGIHSFIQVPLKIGGEVFGVFSTDYTRPHAFSQREQRLLIALAQRAALAIENAQLYGQAQELAAVQERSRLARDLHDAVTQTLFSASLIAEVLPTLWEEDQEEGRQLLQELRQLSRGALAEMRTLLLELRPAALTETGLGDLLRQLADAASGREGFPFEVSVEGQYMLPPEVHVALYRIAQEALNNVVKHAQASQVALRLRCSPGGQEHSATVALEIVDNGRGFDTDSMQPDHLGLGIMRERAQAIGADLEIRSQPGRGTQVLAVWREQEGSGP